MVVQKLGCCDALVSLCGYRHINFLKEIGHKVFQPRLGHDDCLRIVCNWASFFYQRFEFFIHQAAPLSKRCPDHGPTEYSSLSLNGIKKLRQSFVVRTSLLMWA